MAGSTVTARKRVPGEMTALIVTAAILVTFVVSALFCVRYLSRENTNTAPDFTMQGYASVRLGDTRASVVKKIGQPAYIQAPRKALIFEDENGTRVRALFEFTDAVDQVYRCKQLGPWEGGWRRDFEFHKKPLFNATEEELIALYGDPVESEVDDMAFDILHYQLANGWFGRSTVVIIDRNTGRVSSMESRYEHDD